MTDDPAVDTLRPSELRVSRDRKLLKVRFAQEMLELPAELLRVLSPSAEVQGHSAEQRKTVSGKREVKILQIEPTGNYAIRILFDDMHDTGIFSWRYLHELGTQLDAKWRAYEAELAEKGLSRDG